MEDRVAKPATEDECSVFGQEYAAIYDRLYVSKDYSSECDQIDWAIERYGRPKSTSILDLGCGTGGHAYELSRRGYVVTGVDQSGDMIRLARDKSNGGAPSPSFLVGDVTTIQTGQTYDAVLMMFAVMGYLTSNEKLLAGLATARAHLAPGGVFVADFWYGPGFLSDPPVPKSHSVNVNGRTTTRASVPTIDWERDVCEVRFELAEQDAGVSAVVHECHMLRYFFIPELQLALQQVGLELCQTSSATDWQSPLDHRDWNAALVARCPE